MQPIGSILSMILSGVVLALTIALPALLLLFVIRLARNYVTPHQKEVQRLLAEAVELLKENNRLLRERSETGPNSSKSAS